MDVGKTHVYVLFPWSVALLCVVRFLNLAFLNIRPLSRAVLQIPSKFRAIPRTFLAFRFTIIRSIVDKWPWAGEKFSNYSET